jgi:hypothetical protein
MKYYIPDHGETATDAIDIGDSRRMYEHDSLTAEAAAAHAHYQHGCWEANWPLTIVLVDDDGRTSSWTAYREAVPSFHAVQNGKKEVSGGCGTSAERSG